MDSNKLTSRGASTLFRYLAHDRKLKAVSLQRNLIDDYCMEDLGKMLKKNKAVVKLELSRQVAPAGISDEGIEALAPYIISNSSLKMLNLSGSPKITDKSVPTLLKIAGSSGLISLDIRNTSITESVELRVSLKIKSIKSDVKVVSFLAEKIDDTQALEIAETIEKHPCNELTTINFEENNITSKGMNAIFKALKGKKNLQVLYLRTNQFDDGCMESLAELLVGNDTITDLGLSENNITDEGFDIIGSSLLGNTKMKVLWLRDLKITEASVPMLKAIASQTYIDQMVLSQNDISDESKKEIEKLLAVPHIDRPMPVASKTKSAAKTSKINNTLT